MQSFLKSAFAGLAATLMLTSVANGATLAVFDGIAAGRANFDSVVTGAGATVSVDTWTNLAGGTSIDRGDYVVTRNNGGLITPTTYGTLSGEVADISPFRNDFASDPSGVRTSALDYFDSGVTLTFGTAVNSVGFEVGDWATCCFDPVTELFISFDDGAPIKVASASNSLEGLFPSQDGGFDVYEILVGAFDDTGSFSKVSFWGNGLGEFLVFGGEVRYALIDEGSLPPPTVPLPATSLMLMGGLASLAGLRRLRKKA